MFVRLRVERPKVWISIFLGYTIALTLAGSRAVADYALNDIAPLSDGLQLATAPRRGEYNIFLNPYEFAWVAHRCEP